MSSSPSQPAFVASPTLVPDAMHSLDPESPSANAGPSSTTTALSSSARKQRDRGTSDKEKRSKKDKSSSKDKDKGKDRDPAQREARRAERERRKAARRSVTSVDDSAAGGSNDADSVVPPTASTPVTPTSLVGTRPQQPRTRTLSGSSAELDADESVPLAVSNSMASRRISRALSAISQQDVMSYGGSGYGSGNAYAATSTFASATGQASPRTPVFPPTASAAQARRHSQLIAPPSAADDHLPLSVHRQSMILQEENLPIAVAQKRRSMYSDHRTNSVASFADLLSQHSGTHGSGMSSATLNGGVAGGPPPMYAAPTPGAFTPRSPNGSTFGVSGQQGSYPMQQLSGGSQRGSMVFNASAKPRKGSAPPHLPPPPVPQQQPQPQLSAFQQITRKLSGRRSRGPPTANSSHSGSNHGGTHFADIESQTPNTGFQRKRSLVRRDRAQHHGRTPSGQPFSQGTAHHHHRATLNGMRGNPDGPPGGGPASSTPLPPNISRRPITLPREKDYSRPETTCRKAWVVFSKIITFYAVSPLLAACGMPDPQVQQAWREKMALCTIIAMLMAALAFLTFAFNAVLCQPSSTRLDSTKIGNGFVIINGFALDVTNYNHNFQSSANNNFGQFPFWEMYGESQSRQNRDLSFMFQNQYAGLPECVSLFGPQYIRLDEYLFPCTIGAVAEDKGARKFGRYPASYCHKDTAVLRSDVADFTAKGKRRQLFVPWDQLENTQNDYLAFNGQVIDLSIIYRLKKPVNWSNLNGVNFEQVFKRYKNKDATMFMSSNATMSDAGKCLTKIARVGSLDSSTMGCIASDVVLWLSLLVILSLVLSRFFMAIIFRWVLAPKLGRKLTEEEKRGMLLMRNARERDAGLFGGSSVGGGNGNGSIGGTRPGSYMSAVISGTPGDRRSVWSQYDSLQQPPAFTSSPTSSPAPGVGFSDTISTLTGAPLPDSPKTNPAFGNEATSSRRSSTSLDIQRSPRMMPLREPDLTKEEVMHTILLVTCYSEDEHGIRTTLDSLAATHYMDTHKLLFVIADGIIMGAGNEKSTPEIIVSMMEKDPTFPEVPKPYSYVAIADGAKRHNMAAVHAGYYNYEGHRVPMVVVVKCGGPEEKDLPKPGNRGKRDSQIVLMSFLQKVMFDERMTPLEYDLFQKIHKVARVTPDVYEMVLMVDADTKVAPDSVERMVACFARDHTVMGLCGETQIENKFGSWVTMIQVFEYYISHHLAKAFESVFGGVTCLPGCFCAYRIKTPKGEHGRHWVPILANPDIVDQYQENVVETLHEKNLFLLGEDRYLTTLMLKTFPKRKMLFVPQATCETTVPDQFSVLLSQRRRWINSTIHNLMELVLVKDLCGTFCISMQFVIAIELFGTLVLPAAICFTIYLVVISFFSDPVPVIPLLLLAAILGLPGLLIVFTTRKWQFLFWMVIYLLSLPVWNLILPSYAFWHFDDFSWGATRVVQGGKDGHDDDDGEFDSSKIIMKRYAEWEQIKQRAIAQALEAAAHQHQQAYRRTAQMQMQQYFGVDNQLVRSNGLEYTA